MEENNEVARTLAPLCRVCQSMSSWDFLRGFYRRVDEARDHSLKLEYDLHRAGIDVTKCRQTLADTKALLDEERSEHGRTREELKFECDRHRETERMAKLTYDAVQQSCVIVGRLRGQVAELQGDTIDSVAAPTTAELMLDLQVTKDKLKWLEDWIHIHHSNCVQKKWVEDWISINHSTWVQNPIVQPQRLSSPQPNRAATTFSS